MLNDLGVALKLPSNEIEVFRTNNPDNIGQAAREMIQRWNGNTEDSVKAWEIMKNALREAQLTRCITDILEVQKLT